MTQLYNKSGIYQILNENNNKIYVGCTRDLYTRIKNHERDLKNNRHSNKRLQKDWNTVKGNKFYFEVIEMIENKDIIYSREYYWILKKKCYDPLFGYNSIVSNTIPKKRIRTTPVNLLEKQGRVTVRLNTISCEYLRALVKRVPVMDDKGVSFYLNLILNNCLNLLASNIDVSNPEHIKGIINQDSKKPSNIRGIELSCIGCNHIFELNNLFCDSDGYVYCEKCKK